MSQHGCATATECAEFAMLQAGAAVAALPKAVDGKDGLDGAPGPTPDQIRRAADANADASRAVDDEPPDDDELE